MTTSQSRVFITGFGPYRDIVSNPSSKLAENSGKPHAILEVAFGAVDEFLKNLDPESFDCLLMLGVASGRDRMSPEFYARNMIGPVQDVRKEIRFGTFCEDEPVLLETTLWDPFRVAFWTMEMKIRASFDAGNYLCNYLYFEALKAFPTKKVGFLHVPATDRLEIEYQSEILATILSELP